MNSSNLHKGGFGEFFLPEAAISCLMQMTTFKTLDRDRSSTEQVMRANSEAK